jgi:NACHT domain
MIIEDVKVMCDAGLATFAYFDFDFKDSSKRDIRNLLSSILVQLSDQSNESRSILNREGQLPTFIIVDALDECPNSPGIPSAREKVLNLVEDFVKSPTDLRICVTSRPEQDIRMVLEPLTSRHISLHVQDGQGDDIFDYVRFTVHSDRTMRRWKLEDKELVIDTLIEKANGM